MSSPAPSASAAVRGEELYGLSPRPSRRPGMQKLQLPSQLGGGANNTSSLSISTRPVPPKLNALSISASSSNGPPQGPSLSLSIPSSKSFSGMHTDAEEGYEGSAGMLTGTAVPSMSTAMPTNPSYRSIYPDTVPYSGAKSTNPLNLTNDLRRAIGGLDLDGKGRKSYDGASNSRSTVTPSTSGGSLGGFISPDKRLSVGSSNASSHHEDLSIESTSTIGQELEEESELQLKGNLEVMDRLGEGASGEVRKARYRPTGLIMAMKTISTSPNPAIHRQILRELSFNRTCHSDYIVKYYGAFLESEDTSIVICMEHCEAGSLDSIYKRCQARNGRMGEKILAKIAESGLKGLAYLHQRKIIHRDIKPSNMLVTRGGQIKLCDFGVSGELINSMAGTFTGTSYYMAPERIRGLPYTITSDVWSLGLTILEMASNRFPFPPEGEPALGPIDLLSYIVSMKTPELKDDESSGIKWTRAFKDFLDNCLEKDGTKRHGPIKMLNHPFIKKTMAKIPQPNIAKFVAEVWGWKYVESAEEAITKSNETVPKVEPVPAPLENVNVPGIGRVASLRVAPSPFAAKEALRLQSIKTSAPPSPKLARLVEPDNRKHSSGRSTIELDDRTAAERAIAKKREADVGLVGSPVEEF